MDNQLLPNKENHQPAQIPSNTTTLNQLAFLCQDDHWLMELIRDTETNQMITAPAYVEAAVLSKTGQPARCKKLKLICYSLKVSLAAAGTILLLFSTPFFLEQPIWKNTPPGSENTAFLNPSPFNPVFGFSHPPNAGQKLRDGLWQISDSISDLSNELLQGGNLHD